MRSTTSQHMSELQKNPKNIRNICILAHVDHGKTTIADALVASNGIISPRLAGKLRYMDSREDEQIRGITMKSSAISLYFKKESEAEEYLINLIDSPGHVDFSSEVSTAVRLCDGAIVVVDVVEGVCPQTHAVLRQAWLEDICPCLVLNKIDRLITELKFSPLEAHIHLQQILEQVNAITGSLFSSQVMEKTSSSSSKTSSCSPAPDCVTDKSTVSIDEWSSGLEETDDSHIYFSPDLGNVVFASAIDGWGFGISDFAEMLAAKLGIKAAALQKTLWGNFYLHSKTKRIFKGAQAKSKKPLFVQFVLENLWAVYDAVMVRRDKLRTEQIVKSLNLRISARDSRYTDSRVYLQAIFGQWLPLSKSLLSMVVNKLPSPLDMSEERVEKLMCSGMRTFESFPQITQQLKKDFMACASSKESPVIVFISKMFAVEEQALPHNRRRPLTQEEITQRHEQARKHHAEVMAGASENGTPLENREPVKNEAKTGANTGVDKKSEDSTGEPTPKNHFMAFARVFSGVMRKGQRLYVLGPRHEPVEVEGDELKGELEQDSTVSSDKVQGKRNEGLSVARSIDRGTNQYAALFTADNLYLLMGRELEAMESVPAGSILGIGGLENHVLKSATISSTLACPPFMALQLEARPIVRVAVEPVSPSDMPLLSRGIRLLNQADPCVETLVQETGEHVIIAAGEVHLQRCVDDLKQRYARIELNVSSPIVPFRETVVIPPKTDMVNEMIVADTSQQQNPKQQFREWSGDNGSKSTHLRERGLVEVTTANKQFRLLIRAEALPQEVSTLLDKKADLLKALSTLSGTSVGERRNIQAQMKESTLERLQEFYRELCEAFAEAGSEWEGAVDCVMAFGPRRTGPNILLNRVTKYNRPSVWQGIHEVEPRDKRYWMFDNSVVSGFQLATLAGPLCEEPMMGVCIVIEEWSMRRHENEAENESEQVEEKDCAGEVLDSNVHLVNKENANSTQTVTRTTKGREISEDVCCARLEENSGDKLGSSETENILMSSVENSNKSEMVEIVATEDRDEKGKGTGLLKPNEIAPKCKDDFTSVIGSKENQVTTACTSENEGDSLSRGDSDLSKLYKKAEKMISSEDSKSTERTLEYLQQNVDCSIAGKEENVLENPSELELEDNDLTKMTKGKGVHFPRENPTQAMDSTTPAEKDITTEGGRAKTERYGPLSGQIMAAVKEGCRRAFALQPMRLMAAMYTCQLQATSDVLGKMYAVVYKREGRVTSEEMREGSDVFDVTAVLPVAESFGFAEEIRKRTSGLAIPQLVFSHWEVVDIDPFWVPTTEEEYLHFGEKADSDNQARKYMNSVRRRKGLYVEEKTVEHAEKQRTLKK